MTSGIELTELFDQTSRRRWWLLCKALVSLPLDRAIELARVADAFITGSSAEAQAREPVVGSEPAEVGKSAEQAAAEQATAPHAISPTPVEPCLKRPNLALSAEQRERLLQRLAQGAKNADLAQEFGLSARQIQGIRMGLARKIAMRRDQLSTKEQHSVETLEPLQSIDEIVRYLRQQDDVVVPEADGEFVINGRFRLGLAELVSRANRMRARQGKPEFKSVNGPTPRAANLPASNGHPIFWEQRSSEKSTGKPVSSV
jgi:hypothetical protein